MAASGAASCANAGNCLCVNIALVCQGQLSCPACPRGVSSSWLASGPGCGGLSPPTCLGTGCLEASSAPEALLHVPCCLGDAHKPSGVSSPGRSARLQPSSFRAVFSWPIVVFPLPSLNGGFAYQECLSKEIALNLWKWGMSPP